MSRTDLGRLRTMHNTEIKHRKTQFTCLGTPYQLAKVDASVFVVKGVAVDLLCSVTYAYAPPIRPRLMALYKCALI